MPSETIQNSKISSSPNENRRFPFTPPDSIKREVQNEHAVVWFSASFLVLLFAFIVFSTSKGVSFASKLPIIGAKKNDPTSLESCYRTCRISVVESVPQNITITKHPLPSTFEAWYSLIQGAQHTLDVAAYKSSLRGHHVFGSREQEYSVLGELIYEEIQAAGLSRDVNIRVVENSPSKDKGDNADGRVLEEQGVIDRRSLNLQKIYKTGIMHSKFLVADGKDFYIGSANLDWRSLNQKMELGVLVQNCPCLASELTKVFDLYWKAANAKDEKEMEILIAHSSPLTFNMRNPLRIQYQNVDTDVYIATSPRVEEVPNQTWDLDAIVEEIGSAKTFLFIHVMDIFPCFLYSQNQRFWPVIDNALRAAVLRGVNVKIIAAALHYPRIGLSFLKSLEQLNEVSTTGSVNVRIFKVPTPAHMESVMRRERRTHKKVLVTDTSVVIGTSNWSADYYEGIGTGVAIVVRQNLTEERPFVVNARNTFLRDWDSPYTYSLDYYYDACISSEIKADFCEGEKDKSLLATAPGISAS